MREITYVQVMMEVKREVLDGKHNRDARQVRDRIQRKRGKVMDG